MRGKLGSLEPPVPVRVGTWRQWQRHVACTDRRVCACVGALCRSDEKLRTTRARSQPQELPLKELGSRGGSDVVA